MDGEKFFVTSFLIVIAGKSSIYSFVGMENSSCFTFRQKVKAANFISINYSKQTCPSKKNLPIFQFPIVNKFLSILQKKLL